MMKKILIINSCILPVPPVKGGAVENLEYNLILYNEKKKECCFDVLSVYDKEAENAGKKLENTRFLYFQAPRFIKMLDSLLFHVTNILFSNEKSMRFRYLLERFYIIRKMRGYLCRAEVYDKIIFENSSLMYQVIRTKKLEKRYRNRCIFHVHNELKNAYGCSELLNNSKILCVSRFIKESLPDYIKEGVKNNSEVLRNGVDIRKFSPDMPIEERNKIRRKYEIDKNAVVFLFCGQLKKEKGIKELLLAFHRLTKTEKNCVLLVAGSYFYGSNLHNKFEKELEQLYTKCKKFIRFTGYIDYSEMNKIYGAADIACMPSIWNDPAPLTIIESIASGIPLITTLSGGIPEYAGRQCAVLLQRDAHIVNNLYLAMKELAEQPEHREKMRKAALGIRDKLDMEKYCETFMGHILRND